MEAWYDEQSRPKIMTKKEKQRNWMQLYLDITGLKAKPMEKEKKVKTAIVWEVAPPTKQEMRTYYKETIRVKGKAEVQRFTALPRTSLPHC